MYYGGYDNCCYPTYDYGCCGYGYAGGGYGINFALIVVLFILLVIIGTCWMGPN